MKGADMKTILKYETVVGKLFSLLLTAANVLAISFIIILATNTGFGV